MAANEKEFTLIGRFDDQISKKLKEINANLDKLNKPLKKDNAAKSLISGFEGANKELKTLREQLEQINKFQMKFDKSGIRAATEEVKTLGREIESVSKAGFNFDKSGIVAAQKEADILGDILRANALVKVGEGFVNALSEGARSAVGILQRGMGFVGKQFGLAVSDQLEDLQARGSLYGALSKSGVFGKQSTEKEMSENYGLTRSISRANEQAIGEVVRTSSVSTGVVTTLSRQMTDNLLPSLLKARGITSLAGKDRDELDKIFGGEKGIGTELASVYEKMATVIPNAGYAKQAAFGFTQAISSGTINRQLAIFENNPVLVDALKTLDGGIAATSDVGKRIVILKKALEIAAPTMMLDEMRNTLAGGLQAVEDTLTNPTVGILSLGADIANEGKKTLEQYKEGGERSAYAIKLNRVRRNIEENADKLILKGLLERVDRAKFVSEHIEEAEKKLTEALENSDSPIEKISVSLAPVLQEFASLLNSFGNLFLGPVTEMMKALNAPLAQLENSLAYLTTEVVSGEKTMGEALGRAVGEMFKALAEYFNPLEAGKVMGDGINSFFDDFMRGFKNDKFDGEKYMKIVLDTLLSIIMKLIFKEGNAMKGMTGLGDALAKVFLLLAAPAFISALISGLVPVALLGIGSLLKGVFTGLTTKALAASAARTAAVRAAEVSRIAAAAEGARTASIANAALGATKVGAAGAGGQAAVSAGAGLGGVVASVLSISLLVVALTAAFVIFETPLRAFSNWLIKTGDELTKSRNWAMSAFGVMLQGLGTLLEGLTDFFTGIWDIVSGMFTGDADKIGEGIKKLFSGIGKVIVGVIKSIAGLGGVIVGAIGNLFNAMGSFINNLVPGGQVDSKPRQGGIYSADPLTTTVYKPGSVLVGRNSKGQPLYTVKADSNAFGSDKPFTGNLREAINFEMTNKPANSHLVIANSSETVIPAAKGFGGGLRDLVSAVWGAAQMTVSSMVGGLEKFSSKTVNSFKEGFDSLERTTYAGQSQLLSAIKATAASRGFVGDLDGGMLGGSKGSLSGALRIAKTLGLAMTSYTGGRHAAGSLHYSGRAMDFAGDPGAMSRLAASLEGTRPTELIHAPGFSMKSGRRVPPSYWGEETWNNHFDHVHVAYALGKGRPAMFSSQAAAEAWERKMIPTYLKVRTVTTNSGESGFGSASIHAPITIYQQPNQDSEQLASMVAIRIGMAIDELTNR